jgi:hypothetical protein
MSQDAKSGAGDVQNPPEQVEDAECVVCGSEEHDGKGWIFPVEDTEVIAIKEDGLERELADDARPICSIECKDEFDESDGGAA